MTEEGDEIEVYIDIKPGACPNYLNIKSRGFIQVAVLGTQEFDVMTIEPEEIFLYREEVDGKVAPVRWKYEDTATPVYEKEDPCDCHNLDGDGNIDLVLKFDLQELIGTLDLASFIDQTVPLTLTGEIEDDDEDEDDDDDEEEEEEEEDDDDEDNEEMEDDIIGQDCIVVIDQRPSIKTKHKE